MVSASGTSPGSASIGKRRILGVALLAFAILLMPAVVRSADASTVAYIKGNEVWVSTLDGKKKKRISAGQGDWRQVVASDNGRILGIRLRAGKISQLSKMQLWNQRGKVISQGPLPYTNRPWSSYAAPVGLDLSSDGVFAAFGYSGYTGIVPNASFFRGHHVVNADNKVLNVELGLFGEWPTMFGRRAVVAEGSVVYIQRAAGAPFGRDYDPLLEIAGSGLDLTRSDISATGRLVSFDLQAPVAELDRIGLVSISGVNPPATVGARVDCYLPTVGDASYSTLSQDGTRIAWADRQGVKVAGVPKTLGDPCRFSSKPVLIARGATSPSIGGASFRDLNR